MSQLFCKIKDSRTKKSEKKRKNGEEKGKEEKEDTDGPSALNVRIGVKEMKPAEHSTQTFRTPASTVELGGSQSDGHHGAPAVPVSSGQTQPSCAGADAPQAPMSTIPTESEVLRLIAVNYMQATKPSNKDDFDSFLAYMKEMQVTITGVRIGSLLITVKCDSLQILERLWESYLSGHLGEVVQRCFVTEEILTELSLAELKLETTISEEEYNTCKKYLGKDPAVEADETGDGDDLTSKDEGAVTANPAGRQGVRAIPLCLPNNCQWNSETFQCVRTRAKRSSLYVVDEALEMLRKEKGPVCVVSVAGPYRKGKSYILSEAFNQPEVFPLGHEMVAETMGIWLWIVPEKYKDSRGQEFTVVLLDSEGIDAADGESRDDNQIFTLTVLLASVLIYNSQGVPTRRDLEGLDFIVKLSQRIHIRSNGGRTVGAKETEFFHRTFPFFIWLLRDVTQSIPRDCRDIKDYFLKKVFRDQGSLTAGQGQKVAESILRLFPGFDAFDLPLPSANDEVMRSLNDNKDRLESKFKERLTQFKSLLRSTLVPKHSYTDGEFVTGEGLAALVTLYVDAINTPGAIPNVQCAWDTFVHTKCLDAKKVSQEKYDELMKLLLSEKLPCDNDELRKCHNTALEESEALYMTETTGISTNTVERHLRELKAEMNKSLNQWQTENAQRTKQRCEDLLSQLKRKHLDPVLQQLRGTDGSKLSFDDIIGVYHLIKDDYDARAVGAKDAIAAAFFNYHPELAKETKRHLELLRQLKNFDEKAAREKAEDAYLEQERRRLEEQQLYLQQENKEHRKEMQMLITRLEKERVERREKMKSENEVQQQQLQNMMAAHMGQAEKEREAFIKEKHALEERFLEMQKSNEENMKMMKTLSELIARHEGEKMKLCAQMTALPKEQMEASLKEMNDRHSEEVRVLLEKMDIQIDGIDKMKKSIDEEAFYSTAEEKERAANLEELPLLMNSRKEMVSGLQQRIAETEKEKQAVEKSAIMKQGFKVLATVAPVVGKAIAAAHPPSAPFAEPIANVVSVAAAALSECDCIIM